MMLPWLNGLLWACIGIAKNTIFIITLLLQEEMVKG